MLPSQGRPSNAKVLVIFERGFEPISVHVHCLDQDIDLYLQSVQLPLGIVLHGNRETLKYWLRLYVTRVLLATSCTGGLFMHMGLQE